MEKGYSLNEVPTPPETPPETVKPRFGRKLYLVIGLVAIAIIVSVIVFTQFMPSAKGEAIPLGLNYSVGEKMTYEFSITTEAMGTEVSQEGTLEMEVQSFDGENYTIRQTMTLASQEFSFTVKMNQMGRIIDYIGLSPELEQTFSSFIGVPGFGSYFTKEEARVGESWEIPLDIEVAGMNLEGTLSYKLSEITSITVPAGIYDVLKFTIKSSGFQVSSSMEGTDYQVTSDINGYVYLRNATCCLIEFRFDQTATMTVMGETQSVEMSMQMQLIEHTK